MKKFGLLLLDELERTKGFTISLILFQFVSQGLLLLRKLLQLKKDPSLQIDFADLFKTPLFGVIIGGIVIALLFYCYYIWGKEYTMRGSFIYRLMTLPGSRMSVLWAKFVSIYLLIFTVLTVQILIFYLTSILFNSVLASANIAYAPWYLTPQLGSEFGSLLGILMPNQPLVFFIQYALGANFILAIFFGAIFYFNRRKPIYLLVSVIPFILVGATYLYLGVYYTYTHYLTSFEGLLLEFLAAAVIFGLMTLIIRRELVTHLNI